MRCASTLGKIRKTLLGTLYLAIWDFYFALTLAALYRKASLSERLSSFVKISVILLRFKKYARLGPSVSLHYYLLLKAERARIIGRRKRAALLYEEAAAAAKREGIFAVEALANELAARFYLEEGREKIAALFLEEALRCYEKWGAKRKIALLTGKFEKLLGVEEQKEPEREEEPRGEREAKTVTIAVAAGRFDIAAMRRSGEVIASTILMRELQMKLMNLVMQHGGAERGLLIMAREGGFFIEAESSRRSAETRLLQGEELSDKMLPFTLVKEVIRSKRELVLEDAIRDDRYKGDPYIKRARIRSLLFAPLLNNNRIAAILYLENNLSKNSFTEERCQMINFLSSQLAMSIDNAKLYEGTLALSAAYERFVPKDFINLLGKERILDIALGDHREREMSVLFTDIRSFTALSEAMTPKENFAFINEFLGYMEPVIRKHSGFIDKYIGDAIMALFPGKADDAVGCAVAMLEALKLFNSEREKRGEPPVAIGIGINSGLLILGTVGSALRMDGTVISDAVNIASRVEHLTKEYGTPLLITEESFKRLTDKSAYPLAPVGETPIRGKREKIALYTLLTHFPQINHPPFFGFSTLFFSNLSF